MTLTRRLIHLAIVSWIISAGAVPALAQSFDTGSEAGGPAAESLPVRRQPRPAATPAPSANSSIDPALQLLGQCRDQYRRAVRDYTCTFYKRERINGVLRPYEYITMKFRDQPLSVYLRWEPPSEDRGQEAIFVAGRNRNKVLAHDSPGISKVVAGSVRLDPYSKLIMDDNRHSIVEAGIGNLIETLIRKWTAIRGQGNVEVEIRSQANVNRRPCYLVKVRHPVKDGQVPFYRVSVYVDKQWMLPIRLEAYDWPRPGSAPNGDLMEEYTFTNVRFNLGLTDFDFDAGNRAYHFGHFR